MGMVSERALHRGCHLAFFETVCQKKMVWPLGLFLMLKKKVYLKVCFRIICAKLAMFVDILTLNLVILRVGCNLEYGNLENGKLETILISKITATGISKKSNGYLEFSLENGNLEK